MYYCVQTTGVLITINIHKLFCVVSFLSHRVCEIGRDSANWQLYLTLRSGSKINFG